MKIYFTNHSRTYTRTTSSKTYMYATYCLFSLQKVRFLIYYNEQFNEMAGAVVLL